MEKAKRDEVRLYVCFLDYKKFYDKCSRPHMWTTLFGMGFRGHTALALHKIFATTWNSIRLAPGVYTAPFKQTDGVWQGSSPSTLLASLVFEKFIAMLNKAFPASHDTTPTTAAGDPLNVLAFCDDLVLLSTS